MLRIIGTNVMGRFTAHVTCVNHGDLLGHVVWSGHVDVGREAPGQELSLLADALREAERSWQRGEFEFTDDC